MNRGKIYNIMIGAPSDITDDLFLNDKWPKETHSIFDLRNDNGKLRVYEGKRFCLSTYKYLQNLLVPDCKDNTFF